MKEFNRLAFNQKQCLKDLIAFRELITTKSDLLEQEDIKPFFESHPQLAVFVGTVCGGERWACDLYSFQYQLFGDFGCDLVVGDSTLQSFVFIEWEDGSSGSLFRQQGRKSTPEWSGRLERGFSQIVDWFWKLEDMSRTDEYQTRFGSRHADYVGLLIMGRDTDLQHSREANRWQWRSRKVKIDSKPIRFLTYDQLLADLMAYFDYFFPGKLK